MQSFSIYQTHLSTVCKIRQQEPYAVWLGYSQSELA